MNIIWIFIALILFGIFLLLRDGSCIPDNFPAHAWVYLSLSGIVGFFIGDIFLFKALVELGPLVAMLIHSLAAPTSAIIGWLFLNEIYVLHQWLGITITLLGVAIVILEKNQKVSTFQKLKVRRISLQGIVYGFLAILGQAGGYVLSKAGMQTETGYLDAFAVTQIRALAAFLCFVLFF